jgi:hypothetical protein
MKKLFLIPVVLVLSCLPVAAQSEPSQGELSWTYSYLSRETEIANPVTPGTSSSTRVRVPVGIGMNLTWNLSQALGIVSDFSYHRRNFTASFPPTEVKTRDFIFLFGPRFYLRSKHVTGFGHALFGGTRSSEEFIDQLTGGTLQRFKVTSTSFTMGFGGGVDINPSSVVAFRAFQFDYLPTHRNGNWVNNYRASTGVVFRFGDY